MKREIRKCKKCSLEFTIEPDDFGFYEKIGVLPPALCSDCRFQRRLTWRNDLSFYNRKCDLCKEKIISLYHPNKKLVVYCNRCWWSDKWDPKKYGKDIDFSRPFFEQFRELQNEVPLLSLINDNGVGSVNCEYTQNVTFAKNCYMVSMSWYAEDVMYGYSVAGPETRDIMDSTGAFSHSQLVYEGIFIEHCYNCRSVQYSTSLTDCTLCYDCKGCSDCFMCANLRQAKYCILNKQYTKEEYEAKLKEYKLDTYSGFEKARREFDQFLLKQPRRYAMIINSVNTTGNGLVDCKNSRHLFFCRDFENCRYIWRANEIKDSYDLSPGGKSEQCYESLTADHAFQTLFSIFSLKNQEVSYTENCHSSKHLFGCCAIKHGKYCILNKEYSREEYFKLKEKLIEHMKRTGEYGEFFPSEMSNFGYNETIAQKLFPLSKEEALKQGFLWWDDIQKTKGKTTLRPENIPDSIHDINEEILNEVLECAGCKRNYKIIKNEYLFYKKQGIPVPRKCMFCRYDDRQERDTPMKLWHRTCMCKEEGHRHEGGVSCANEFETSYSPDRPEIVYCESCYQKEVY